MFTSFIAPRSVPDPLNATVAASWPTEHEESALTCGGGRVLTTVVRAGRCRPPDPEMFAYSEADEPEDDDNNGATPNNRRRCRRLASLMMRSSTLGGSGVVVAVPASTWSDPMTKILR